MIARAQLAALGWSRKAIEHALRTKLLHPLWRGVYAVGRPDVDREGRWCAALLACGPAAVLSHGSAAALWGLGALERGSIEISIPARLMRRRPGIAVHRSRELPDADSTLRKGLAVTIPARTVLDLAPRLSKRQLERVVNEAANLELLSPTGLRAYLAARTDLRGARRLQALLDRRTFRLTRSELERRFIPIAVRAGLGVPQTRVHLEGFEVDFYFPDLDLVAETDGLRFHRTPAQQARDRLRDQAHTAAGRTVLRFTHEQVRYEAAHTETVLRRVAHRLRGGA